MLDADETSDLLSGAERRLRTSIASVDRRARELRELLHKDLPMAASASAFDRAEATVRELATEGQRAVSELRSLVRDVDRLRREWTASHRYTEEGLATLEQNVATLLAADARAGARAWLRALHDAADAGEEEAAAAIATAPLEWPEELRPGAGRLGSAFATWRDGGPLPDLEPVEELASGRLEGWTAASDDGEAAVVTPELQSRTHRLAAWIVLRAFGTVEQARDHMEMAVQLYPYAGPMHAERAAFHLFSGEFDQAAVDAQHAIELAPAEPYGYLTLGIWAELTGDFVTADELYERALARMATAEIARIHERSALVDPPGRLLAAAAAAMLEAGRPDCALELADQALLNAVRGLEPHPEAEVYVVRRRAFERLPHPDLTEAAKAAVQAGRLCIWNGDVDRAIEELDRAVELDGAGDARWLLADALLTKSYPLGAAAPDQELVARARTTWEEGVEKTGFPSGAAAWAYVTRAIACDLESQAPDAERRGGLFEALMYVEKALVHNHTDAQRWGFVAQFLRYLGLEQLAFEAAEAGYRLASADRQVLAERLPLLANRREFDEAEAVAEQLVVMYGEDPWVSAVRAWLALHGDPHEWERTLELLRLPLRQGNDQAWYREMQALAYLGLGRVEEARAAYERLLQAQPLDGNTKCRLARASLALGAKDGAERCVGEANTDPTTPKTACPVTSALVALAEDDVEAAVRSFAAGLEEARSPAEVDDIVFETELFMDVFDSGGPPSPECRQTFRRAIAEAADTSKLGIERDPPDADQELAAALGELDEGPPEIPATALFALAARRHAAAGRAGQARDCYKRLRGSPFEPEASIALGGKPPQDEGVKKIAAARSG